MYLNMIDPAAWVSPRAGEVRLGQALDCLDEIANQNALADALDQAWQQGRRIALLGVPESIGPRANLGRGGAEHGWDAALKGLLNLQASPVVPYQILLVLGAIDCDDLEAEAADLDVSDADQLARLRELCGELDKRVSQVLKPVFRAGFDVILIGGGHNNAYPLLRSLAEATDKAVGAVNLDPHSDFRTREGRHSGNGFSYAYMDGALAHYHVVGLHEGKNNATSLQQLAAANFSYRSIHQLYRNEWPAELAAVRVLAESWQVPLGIEIDVDSLQGVPASAINFNGLSVAHGYSLIERLAALPATRYLHLAEAAPGLHPAGRETGSAVCAQLLGEFVLAYLHGYQRRTP
ncbi:formimidoylglutamase [Pseudidiomarina sp.]|uniref:formimidoylglutamase n=1 Tax=Pseudidiomarina sp. TaxID=2081707 RepID=UPI00299EF5FD|nr:formimidoylglutamase [Pseudidiomarina sp.]MDX1706025.1 formimidoylglutamase [Pseudidiomarina sp.]